MATTRPRTARVPTAAAASARQAADSFEQARQLGSPELFTQEQLTQAFALETAELQVSLPSFSSAIESLAPASQHPATLTMLELTQIKPMQLAVTESDEDPFRAPKNLLRIEGRPAPQVARALTKLIESRCDVDVLARGLEGETAEPYGIAADYLLGEIFRWCSLAAQHQAQNGRLNARQAHTARTWLFRLLDAGRGSDQIVMSSQGWRTYSTTVLGAAALKLDTEVLTRFVAARPPKAQSLEQQFLALRRTTAEANRDFRWLSEGGALALCARAAGENKAKVMGFWEDWETAVLSRGTDAAQALFELAKVAAEAADAGWTWPQQCLISRLLHVSALDAEGAAGELWLSMARRGDAAGAANLCSLVAPLRYRTPTEIDDPLGYPVGPTRLAELALVDSVSEDTALFLVDRLAASGADFRGLTFNPESNAQVIDKNYLFSASLLAARCGKYRLAASLRACESTSRQAHRGDDLTSLGQLLATISEVKHEVAACLDPQAARRAAHAFLWVARSSQQGVWSAQSADLFPPSSLAMFVEHGALASCLSLRADKERADGLPLPLVGAFEAQRPPSMEPSVEQSVAPSAAEIARELERLESWAVAAEGLSSGRKDTYDSLGKRVKNHLSCGRLTSVVHGEIFGDLNYLTSIRDVAALHALLHASDEHDPWDLASAYVHALVLPRTIRRGEGAALSSAILQSVRTPLMLWATMFGALQLRDIAEVLKVAEVGRSAKLVLDDITGNDAPRLLALAAETSVQAMKAVLGLLKGTKARRRWLLWTDDGGDNVLHTACRRSTEMLSFLAGEPGFGPQWLVYGANASGYTPLEQAVRGGAAKPLQVIATQRVAWKLDDSLRRAVLAAAKDGQEVGMVALLRACPSDDGLFELGEQTTTVLRARKKIGAADAVQNCLRALRPKATQSSRQMTELPLASRPSERPPAVDANHGEKTPVWRLAEAVRVAPSVDKRELALNAFEKHLEQPLVAGESVELRNRVTWSVIDSVERAAFGQYFGRHFVAHLPRMQDAQLLRRITSFGRYGSSRFGPNAASAILRLRRRALVLAARGAETRNSGRYVLHLSDAGSEGSGFVVPAEGVDPQKFSNSSEVRVVVSLRGATEPPQIVSMYPVFPRSGTSTALGVLVPSTEI